jgi:hypothetical protein
MPAELSDSVEQKRALVDRVADSPLFQKSPRLREFLLYVADCTLTDQAGGAREQVIAEKVFNRKPDYAAQDSIVRAEARNLRKRLEAYFATDGKDESTIIEMPRGQYLLAFLARQPSAGGEVLSGADMLPAPEPVASGTENIVEPDPPAGAPAATGMTRLRTYRRLCAALAAVVVVLTAVAVWQFMAGAGLRRQMPPLPRSLPLSAVFSPAADTLIVTSDATLVPFFSTERRRVNLNDYITRTYPASRRSFPADLARKGVYTDGQEMAIAGELLRANPRAAQHVYLRSGHQIELQELKGHNLILLGSTFSNPWGQMFEEKLNFRLELDERARNAPEASDHPEARSAYPCDANIVVRNLSPRAGEPPLYPCYDNNHSFAVVSFTPAGNGAGNVLWIAGTTAESTAAAGDFVLDDRRMNQALRAIGVSPEGTPRFFELLLKVTSFVGGASLAEVVASRAGGAH